MARTPQETAPSVEAGRDAWGALTRMTARLVESVDRETFLDEALDAVVEALGADRGLLLLFHGDGSTQAVHARRRGRSLDAFEREEISRTIVERVRREGACVVWHPLEDVPASESVHLLGIGAAIVAPVRAIAWRGDAASGPCKGVLYVDFRGRPPPLGDAERALATAAANVMAGVLDPLERLAEAREDLRAIAARRAEDGPTLDELLRPDSMRAIRAEVLSALRGTSPILLLGESGTGKTQLARAIAEASGRTPIVRAVLGSSDDLNTITSELFGHEKGAFSGALSRRTGLVEYADGGTLIFDEILNLPPNAQQLLLDFTQFGSFRPLGWERREPRHANVRVIAATNGDLDRALAEGRFRQDLYYRIAAVPLTLPPLRDRREDVPSLAEAVLRRIDRGREWRLSVPLRRLLMSEELAWPGNVRQLEAVVARARERAITRSPEGRTLGPEHVEPRDLGCVTLGAPRPRAARAAREASEPLCGRFQIEADDLGDSFTRLSRERAALDDVERTLVLAALARHGNVAAYAARELGVPRTSLISRMATLGIDRPPRSRR